MKRICVFCGSSMGSNEVYKNAAAMLGKILANHDIELVYGGGNVGLMGIMADAALENGGKVTGVIPQSIADLEIAHNGLTKLHVVKTMGERKDLMGELADAFIAMPGGFGTLDELSEVLTYNQLRIYDKPIGLLNINAYFDGLLEFFDHAVTENFVRAEHRQNILVSDVPSELLEKLEKFEPVTIQKWIDEIKDERTLN
ncbi:MAG: TIGR00730 family Rossman fold protein [Bacteroidales bacterium]|nr:TIGR00730 family Rossman fold protein [Bacteroidales bacterium]MCF8404935.1 TIGR00730 family Rossman fold protein [Bacteroidales bacterium]